MKYLLQKTLLISMLLLFSGSVFSQKTIAEHVDKLAKKYVKKKRNQGLVIGIIRGTETTVMSYGQMSKTDPSAPDGNTVFEIGSITSVFTTSLMEIQADKNAFQKHEPVSAYLDNGANIPSFYPMKCVNVNLVPDMDETRVTQPSIYRCYEDPSAKPQCISFCDLATHISGLPSSPDDWYNWKPIGKNKKLGDSFKDKSTDKFYEKLQGLKLEYPPGVKYIHSDFGISLLGNAMSDIAKMPFETLLQKQLLHPLKMKNTRMDFSNENKMRIAWGHNKKGKSVPIWKFDAMAPAAGLKSTVNDLLLFANANLTPPKAFENAFAETQQNKVSVLFGKNGRLTSMGYGWYTSTLTEKSNLPVVWMNGGTGGFRSFIGFIKDSNTAVVILSNSTSKIDEMGFDILEIINSGIEPIPTKKTAANF